MTAEKVKAYQVADNKLAELSSWDMDLLKLDMEKLNVLDLDFSTRTTGFEHAAIDLILDEPVKKERDRDHPDDNIDHSGGAA